jgi:hypothetical protein
MAVDRRLPARQWVALALASVLLPSPVTPASGGTEVETVTVEAQRRRERITEQVSQYVTSIAAPVTHESLARWAVAVCPVTVGLAPAEGEFVRKRIAQVASDAGVPLGPKDCAPNFVVVVTPDPESLLRDWWSEDHGLFNYERGVRGVERFIMTEQPVRVWHNACSAAPALARNFRLNPAWNCNTGTLGSRITWESVRSIYLAIVVVDLSGIEGLTYGQVADYVAFVGLAQIRRDADFSAAPTILGLFAQSAEARSAGLTRWDQAFLKSVYASREGTVTELSQIKLKMTEDLAR